MTGVGMQVTGLDECIEMMEDAPKNIVMLGYGRALTAAMYVVAEAVVSRAPVETGEMVKGLVVEVKVDSSARGGIAEMGFGKQGHVAMWVEYGHHMVGHKPGKKYLGFDVQPHPFMRPSFDASADQAVEAFAASLSNTLKLAY